MRSQVATIERPTDSGFTPHFLSLATSSAEDESEIARSSSLVGMQIKAPFSATILSNMPTSCRRTPAFA